MSLYKVMVDDNFHYMDEDERRELGTFATAEEALAACRKLVDDCLASEFKPGMSADELYDRYKLFGEDPFIVTMPGAETVTFSAWTYAQERAQAICNSAQ